MVVAVIWIVDVGVDAALEDRLVVEWFDGGFVCCAGEVDVLAVFVSFALLFVYTAPPVIEECREWSLQRRYMPKIKNQLIPQRNRLLVQRLVRYHFQRH